MDTCEVEVDTGLCGGLGDCARIAPHVFRLGADGLVELVPGAVIDDAAIEAAEACPMAAIAIWRAATGEQVA